MDVELSERYRISGTYGERFLMNALPIPALIVLFLLARNGVNAVSALDMFLIIGIGSLLIWIIDPEPARRKQPVELIDGTVLRVGNSLVTPDSILSITPLRIYKGWTRLIQIDHRSQKGTATAIVLSKPAPIWMAWAQPRTLRLLLQSHP